MRISLLHYSAPPIVGGVESVMGKHARLMSAAGHEVCILAGRGAPSGTGIEYQPLPLLDSRHPEVLAVKAELDQGIVSENFYQIRDRLVTQLRPALAGTDVLIAHNVCSLHKNLPLTAALSQLATGRDIPALVLWHHDLAWTTPRYRAELFDGYPWDLLRNDWPGAEQVVVSALRQRELARLFKIPPQRIHVIPNGVDPTQFFKLEAQTAGLVAQLDLMAAAPLLILPVRITPRKNLELALRTLSVLKNRSRRAAFVVTGPLGPHNPANAGYFLRLCELRSQLGLEKSAHFLAELSDENLPSEVISDFYHLGDALFLPSREEGFGIPVLEAGLAGIPVFCSSIDPLRRLGAKDAFYFSPDADPAQVASLVERALHRSPVYRLRARVRDQFIWERIYHRQIAPLLEQVRR